MQCIFVYSGYGSHAEGWPLLTAETEVNGVLLGWFVWLVVLVQEIFVLP